MTVSRLSDMLSELSRANRMNQPQIVQRSNELGVPLSKGNVSRYLSGKHPANPQYATLLTFAKVFDVPVEDLEAAARYTGREPFEADPSSDQLTAPQRDAVNEIIRLLADGNRSRNEQEPRTETPATQHPSTNRGEDGGKAERREPPMKHNLDLAADTGRSPDHQSGKAIHRRYSSLGEESQIPDDE